MKDNKKTILLVEDEALVAMTEARTLEKHGYSVLTAYSGEDAVEAANHNPGIDLILMDIDLGPGMDGTEAAAIILKDRDVPVVFLSSHAEPEVVQKTEKITSYGYVVKNSGETVLVASVGMALRLFSSRAMIHNQHMKPEMENSEMALKIFRSNPFGMLIARIADAVIIDVNDSMELISGYSREEFIGNNAVSMGLWGEQEDRDRAIIMLMEKGRVRDFECRFRIKKGELRWGSYAADVVELDGEQCFLVTVVDVNTRKTAEDALILAFKEKEALLKEVHHRVKNNLAVISGLISLQADRAGDTETGTVLRDSRGRIQSMALVHEELYRSGDLGRIDFSAYINRHCRSVISTYSMSGRINLEIETDSAKLPVSLAVPCGLILNELITNSMKHAFPGGASGTVRIFFGEKGDMFFMNFEDNGVGLSGDIIPDRADTPGFRIVHLLTRQIKAEIKFPDVPGMAFEMTFMDAV